MIEIYLTDLINIITPAYDEWGAETGTSTQLNIKARIEDTNKLIKNKDGIEMAAQCFLMFDKSALITYESRIQLVSRNGIATQDTAKEYTIQKLSMAHGFGPSHWEAWL